MKQNIFKYIAIAACLFGAAMTAQAQYHEEGDMKTAKNVEGPDEDGLYTITLEAFATGSTTVSEVSTPVDVVLVLDVSGSMTRQKGSVTRSSKTSLSYNDIVSGDVEYFYNTSGSNYYRIYAEKVGNRYYLYYNPEEHYYLYNTTSWGGRVTIESSSDIDYASSSTSETESILQGTFYEGTSRISALQTAVCAFIDEIQLNDLYIVKRDSDGNIISKTRRKDGETEVSLGNRISIVKFAGPGNTYYNENEIVMGFTPTASNDNVQSLKDEVNALVAMGYTEAWEGLTLANSVLANALTGHNSVVVMFTDGEPDGVSSGGITASNGRAYTETISVANTTKNTYDATIYTIGTFDSSPSSTSNTYKYLNAVSSNYTSATGSWNSSYYGTGTLSINGTLNETQDFYKDASGNVNLTKIFVDMAQGIGGATSTIGASTQVRDVVSNSFVIPEGYDPDDVDVFTCAATGETSWSETLVPFNATIKFYDVDKDGKRVGVDQGAGEKTNRAIVIEGFDFSKNDTHQGDGDGNWVGQRFSTSHTPNYFWAGKKLVIKLSIKANGEATGGTGTATNASTSGVYLKNEDGTFTRINQFDQPHTTLTTTLKIKKKGLRSGQSATFEIMKMRPKGWSATATEEQNLKNIEYNIIGKPIPNQHDPEGSVEGLTGSDLYKKMGWEPFSKVVITNKSSVDGAEVTKVLRALDPYWVYMVLEDDWGWAYDMSGSNPGDAVTGEPTTSMVEINPFKFENQEKTDAVKHAEAVTINHFQGTNSSSREEHYKSSKVESFTNPK